MAVSRRGPVNEAEAEVVEHLAHGVDVERSVPFEQQLRATISGYPHGPVKAEDRRRRRLVAGVPRPSSDIVRMLEECDAGAVVGRVRRGDVEYVGVCGGKRPGQEVVRWAVVGRAR
jgi:hypothetical protein